jgi:tetratricopeptide (TPR) repeat protein
MSVQLVDSYYLKALDNYPYDMEETVEALNYALSYNNEHAGALCLMGRVCMDQLYQYDEAEYYFEKAISADPNYIEVYPHFADLLLRTRSYNQLLKLVDFSLSVKGIAMNGMRHRKALALEAMLDLKGAKKVLKSMILDCFYDNDIEFYENELKRLKKKKEALGKTV